MSFANMTQKFAAAGFLIAFLVSQPAQAQSTEPETSEPKPGWSVRCNDPGTGLVCKASQTLTIRKTRQRLLTVSVQRNSDGQDATILLHLPHGLFLPAGIKLSLDTGEPIKAPVQTCDPRGCYAAVVYEPAKIALMQKGQVLRIGFQNLEKKIITVQVSLTGFSAAYAKLRQN